MRRSDSPAPNICGAQSKSSGEDILIGNKLTYATTGPTYLYI